MEKAVGIFDSGVGGLSVLKAIRKLLPEESILYFADQGHVPYGPRPLEEVQSFSVAITRFLLDQGAKVIVVACNAASSASLKHLRQTFPDVPFVGMEPAVKPAAEQTTSKRVAVLATPATFQGALYASVVERFASGVELYTHTCPGLVSQIERGELDSQETYDILSEALLPMLKNSIDTVVLGCTHYPFVIPLIERIVGPQVRVIDPSPAIARQLLRILQTQSLERPNRETTQIQFYTSGELDPFQALLPRLLGETGDIQRVVWAVNDHSLNKNSVRASF